MPLNKQNWTVIPHETWEYRKKTMEKPIKSNSLPDRGSHHYHYQCRYFKTDSFQNNCEVIKLTQKNTTFIRGQRFAPKPLHVMINASKERSLFASKTAATGFDHKLKWDLASKDQNRGLPKLTTNTSGLTTETRIELRWRHDQPLQMTTIDIQTVEFPLFRSNELRTTGQLTITILLQIHRFEQDKAHYDIKIVIINC